MKKVIAVLAILMLFITTASFAEKNDPYCLPLDISVGGYKPNPACMTENGYKDASVEIRTEKTRYNDVDFFVAWVTVQSPTQLRTAVAGKPNQKTTALPSRMAKARNAVFAVNGEFYVQRTRDIFVYRQGEMYRDQADPMKDILIIDGAGDFQIFTSENKAEEIKAYTAAGGTIVNAFSFGPAMVLDGGMVKIREDYYFDGQAKLNRMAIGQVGPLSYVFAECVGKRSDSRGCNHQDMAEFMATLGVQSAYGLDGGQSTVMILNNKYVDGRTRSTERAQSDIIYIATAVPEEEWE